MPPNTTCGTSGYTGPFVWHADWPDATETWRPDGDRFALGVLNVEFLVLSAQSTLTGDGGMFEQNELRVGRGAGIAAALAQLDASYPQAGTMFRRALSARSCDQCPGPREWLEFCDKSMAPVAQPPALADLELPSGDYFTKILSRRQPPAPIWPVHGGLNSLGSQQQHQDEIQRILRSTRRSVMPRKPPALSELD